MVNMELMKVVSYEKLKALGFTEYNDGSGDPRGYWWTFETKNFQIMVDPWMEVKICRENPRGDYITVHVTDLFELECLMDWVADEEE